MGLLDPNMFDNPFVQAGAGIMGNNWGHYGAFGPAVGGGLAQANMMRRNTIASQQALAKLRAEQKQREVLQKAIDALPEDLQPVAQMDPSEFAKQMMKNKFPTPDKYGNTPIYGTGPGGETAILRFDPRGGLHPAEPPAGYTVREPVKFVDFGGYVAPYSAKTGTPGAPINKTLAPAQRPDVMAAQTAAKTEAKATAEVASTLADMEAALPRLYGVVDELSALGKEATYTLAGQGVDWTRRQMGAHVGEGAIARKEYISKVDNEILPLLRQTFGAQFTQKEGESLKATLGDPDASPEEKDAVLRSFIKTKVEQIRTAQRRTGTIDRSGKTGTIDRSGQKPSSEFDELWGE